MRLRSINNRGLNSFIMQVTKTVCGEYLTCYIANGKAYYTGWNGYTVPSIKELPITNAVDGHGGQYSCILMDSSGKPYIVRLNQDKCDTVPVNFTGASKVFALYDAYFAIKAGKVYAFGKDYLKINGGKDIVNPILLNGSANIVKLDGGSSTSFGDFQLSGIDSEGKVWRWINKTPTQVTFPGNIARNIAHVGPNCFVVETATDLFAWGFRPNYVGLPWNQTTPASIKKQYTDRGAIFPLKQLIGNYNTLHVIDSKDDMYGQGDNLDGQVGAGPVYDWKTNPKKLTPYNAPWDMTMYQSVIQIPGKWAEIFTSNSITFHLFALDKVGNLFSWGRNKALNLGNGITLPAFGTNAYDKMPNALDMPGPSYVSPLTQSWSVLKFDPANPPKQTPIPAPVIVEPAPSKKVIGTISWAGLGLVTFFDDYTWSEGDGKVN